ncbi:glycosyltransferase family 4 protein [Candidatus Dependentiae bacterium]|nr:glycosyltransferase family 4 protein [Candidatus Dependentiae bacterium]
MKVLIISHTYISAINRDKWKVLAQRHPDITLTVVFPTQWENILFSYDIKQPELDQEKMSNCSFLAIPAYNIGNEVRYCYHTKKLLTLLKDCKPDLVHVEQGATALSFAQVILCCKFLRLKPRFTFFTWINWRPQKSLGDLVFWNFVRRWNLRNVHGGFTGNHDAAKILQEDGFTKPICVLPQLGISLKKFHPAPPTEKNNSKRIGYVGRLVPEKGVHLLLKAFDQVSRSHPDWELVFVGRGPEQAMLHESIHDLGLSKRVTIINPVPHEEVANLMRSFSLFVLPPCDTPGWKEQFGHVLIEAMACGIPILASNAGEIPNVVGDAGIIFEQKNLEDLTQKLAHLIKDSALRETLAQAGLKRVEKFYSHEAIADATYNFWKTINSLG